MIDGILILPDLRNNSEIKARIKLARVPAAIKILFPITDRTSE